ncbi:MAG: hypothetical protein KKA73_10215 [Chloroflexi bacterium]|nr:hypothetical protein [Chloroflexota bacterium]MBU1748051.1 hypothetical protein [Chloroflexota bacterium]
MCRIIVPSGLMLAFLFLLAVSVATSQAAPTVGLVAPAPIPVAAIHNLPGTAVGLTAGPGGVWVQQVAPAALDCLAPAAAPTSGVWPVQVVTQTLTGVMTDTQMVGRPSAPFITATLTVVTTSVQAAVTSAGLAVYAWPTDTTWLSRPVSGTHGGTAGLWVYRAGSLDFLDPAAGTMTSYQSAALGARLTHLHATVPDLAPGSVVWGLAEDRLFLADLVNRTATVFLGTDDPAAVARVSFHLYGGYYSVWFSDPTRYSVAELLYHPLHPNEQIRSLYQLPYGHQADDLVVVPNGAAGEHATVERLNPWTKQTETLAVWGDLWYLDRQHGRLGHLSMTSPYPATEYDLPASLAQGEMVYADGRLWFTLVGELAAFDPATAVLTRYQGGKLPLVGIGGAPGWTVSGGQANQLLSRYLFYYPLVRVGETP